LSRLAKKGDHEAAARHAFFSGQMERAMNHLRLCKGAWKVLLVLLRSSR